MALLIYFFIIIIVWLGIYSISLFFIPIIYTEYILRTFSLTLAIFLLYIFFFEKLLDSGFKGFNSHPLGSVVGLIIIGLICFVLLLPVYRFAQDGFGFNAITEKKELIGDNSVLWWEDLRVSVRDKDYNSYDVILSNKESLALVKSLFTNKKTPNNKKYVFEITYLPHSKLILSAKKIN